MHMIGDHHGRTARRATLLVRAADDLLGTHRSKGPRWYDWAWVSAHQDGHSLLIRRGRAGELAFYRCWSPSPVTLATLVRAAGSRWAIEEEFQAAKGQVGLDHYQVGTWTGWHRHVTLAMLALAFLMACAAAAQAPPDPWHHARHGGPIALRLRREVPEGRREDHR